MASISRESNGRRTVQFIGTDGKRRSIRLGKVPQRTAEVVKLRVELLVSAKLAGHAIDDETARWIGGLDAVMHAKLSAKGVELVPSREAISAATVGGFLDEFLTRRIDVKPATKEVWGQVVRNLRTFFGEARGLTAVTESDAEDFKMYLVGQKLASTTVHKRLQFARMFFKAAKKRKLIAANPFAEVSAKGVMQPDRQRFITRAEADKLLAACNPTWRLIVSLCRYGGLRCPSEVLSLRWQDVNWETNRLTIQSPKTEHHEGKGSRVIPLFPELREVLTEAFEAAPDGAVYVVDERLRKSSQGKAGWRNCNLRTTFEKIVKRAGLKPWPRLFHAMRASRETELAKSYPIQVVTAWLGNTPRIALKHYLQTTDEDFERAARGGAESGAVAVQNAVQQPAAVSGDVRQQSSVSRETVESFAESCVVLPNAATIEGGEDRIRTCGRI